MGPSVKKRSFSDAPKGRGARPTKKQRRVVEYHSSSEESASDDEGGPIPANLLDSDDEDLDNIEVDDGASTAESGSDSDLDSASDSDSRHPPKKLKQSKSKQPQSKQPTKPFVAKDAPDSSSSDDEDAFSSNDESAYSSDAASHSGDNDDEETTTPKPQRKLSKRNDPTAFATSMSKMLSSKLPASRRADPIVARSAAAAERARQAADTALEAKARKRLREKKRLAMEKGRVRDVLVASTRRTLNLATGEIIEVPDVDAEGVTKGEPKTTGEIMAMERRLRKVAQRGVVKLFNAVRAAQVKAAEAERQARKEGIVGVKRKEEKVSEMSRKGFLDLIASGGGGLKKGGLEEA
ncbi:hypothetical protein VTJ04DRAFT_7582 [Mycothermus thermophilus]|uniref:uncharacterized protein n=1 Tax=Humicola insolens TaxID=85995 RepID=UPI003741F559